MSGTYKSVMLPLLIPFPFIPDMQIVSPFVFHSNNANDILINLLYVSSSIPVLIFCTAVTIAEIVLEDGVESFSTHALYNEVNAVLKFPSNVDSLLVILDKS